MSLLDIDLVLGAIAVPFNWAVALAIGILYLRLPPGERSASLRIRGEAQTALALACTAVFGLALHNEGFVVLDATAVGILRIGLLLLLTAPAAGFAWFAWRVH